MIHARHDAKAHARAHMRGIWAAALMPFTATGAMDEDGFTHNIHHWTGDLRIDGVFVAGKQGEFFSMSIEERKRAFTLTADAVHGRAQTIMSCSDQNMDVVIDLARHAQSVGADYIVVHAPMLHFFRAQDESVLEYYRTISRAVDIGIALWSHPDSGYLMSPALCNRLADIETVVAIKYSVPRPMYAELTALAGDRIQVSTPSEEDWLANILDLNRWLYLCSSPPYLLQTATDRRMRDYTDLAFKGDVQAATDLRDSLNPVRDALHCTRPAQKLHAHQKYWQTLMWQVGGHVRRPEALADCTADLVVEAAGRDAVAPWGRAALTLGRDFAVSSTSAFANAGLLADLTPLATNGGGQLIVPPRRAWRDRRIVCGAAHGAGCGGAPHRQAAPRLGGHRGRGAVQAGCLGRTPCVLYRHRRTGRSGVSAECQCRADHSTCGPWPRPDPHHPVR